MVDTPAVTPIAQAEAQPAIRACLFMLAGSPFAVDVRSAREVAVFDDITVLPRAPAPLIGVANLRGTVIPIVDVRPLLGLPVQRLGRSLRTLIVRDGAVQVALAVEGVLGLEPFEEIMPLDDTVGVAHREFDLGLLKWGDGQATLLDAGRIVQALARQMRAESRATGDSV